MKIPDTARVGRVPYAVRIRKMRNNGYVYFHKKEIHLRGGRAPQATFGTYMHELVHAALYEAGYDAQTRDEKLVRAVASRLASALWTSKT